MVFQPPPDDTSNGYIRGYYIGYRISASSDSYTYKQVERTTDVEQQSTYITGLQPFTKYDIVIKAFNSAGAGPKSQKITGKTLETGKNNNIIDYLLFIFFFHFYFFFRF